MRKFLIKVNGDQYEVEVEEINNQVKPITSPLSASSTVQKPVSEVITSQQKVENVPSTAGSDSIKCPMPGTILKLCVNSGDQVKKGQILLILEAMKMENEIVSHIDGKISDIKVSEGQSVNTGDLLVIFS